MQEKRINENLFPYFEKAGHVLRFKNHQQIYLQGEQVKDFYFIVHGKVRAYLLNRKGQELTIEIVERGRVFGESSFFSQSIRLSSIEAIGDVTLIACNYDQLLPYLSESKELLTYMFTLLAKTNRNLLYQVRRLCFLDAAGKIADFILWMTDHPQAEIAATHDTLYYTHQEVAESVNLQRVTVTRLLHDFEHRGWISLGYRQIKILDRQALQDYLNDKL